MLTIKDIIELGELGDDSIPLVPQCGQPSVNLRQVPGQSNGQWCEIGKRGK